MIGILTEKPSAARNFAKALGGMKGNYAGQDYVIAAARGHLFEFKHVEQQVPAALMPTYKSWDLANLPWNERDLSWTREKKKDVSDTLKTIKSTLSGCDEIIIATDDDPTGEGELLAWEILDELKLRPKKFSRMYFTDEAPKSLQSAFVNRKPIQSMATDPDFIKADYRSKFDFLTIQFTRIATKCGDGVSVLRQGRLKSAMVLIVGDGLKAVAGYKKVPFYENRFKDENGVVYSNPKEPSFADKAKVPQVYHDSDVVLDSKTMKSSSPPRLLDLAALSSMLSGRGIKAKTVLSTYQKMYEAQIVSYPRTEDKFITPEQFQELLPHVDKIAKLVGVDTRLLTHRQPRSTHVKTGCAHGANRPGTNVPASMTSLSAYGPGAEAIYEILARNYLAILSEDYEYEAQKGHVKDYPDFTGGVSVPKKQGWKAVFFGIDDDDDIGNSATGLGTRASVYIHEGFPPKPPQPTMKWLMSQLEKRDVGTGATRVSIYADVTSESAKYPLLIEKKGKLTMTDYGQMSYLLLPGTHIGDLSLTEQLQADMRAVAAGQLDPNIGLARVKDLVRDDIETMTRNGVTMRKELGKTMSEQKEYATGIWRETGSAIRFNKNFRGHQFTRDEIEDLLEGKTIEVKDLVSAKTNKTYGVKGKLTKQTFNGHDFVGFEQTGFLDGIPDEWCKHKFTDAEKSLLEDGKAIEITDAVSKKTGRTFSCHVTYGQTERGGMGIIPKFD